MICFLPRFPWLVAPAVRRLNYVAAVITICFAVLRAHLELFWPPPELSAAAERTLIWFLFLGALSWATLTVSMLCFWFTFDRGATWSGTFWLLGIFLTPLVTAIYCLTRYRRLSRDEAAQQSALAETAAG